MSNPYDIANTLAKAASRARGDRLGKLYSICESQKTISTRSLERIVDELAFSDALDAIHFRKLANRIAELEADNLSNRNRLQAYLLLDRISAAEAPFDDWSKSNG